MRAIMPLKGLLASAELSVDSIDAHHAARTAYYHIFLLFQDKKRKEQ